MQKLQRAAKNVKQNALRVFAGFSRRAILKTAAADATMKLDAAAFDPAAAPADAGRSLGCPRGGFSSARWLEQANRPTRRRTELGGDGNVVF